MVSKGVVSLAVGGEVEAWRDGPHSLHQLLLPLLLLLLLPLEVEGKWRKVLCYPHHLHQLLECPHPA